jgi:hypothetical protein
MSVEDEQTTPAWRRIVLFVVAGLLALLLPFVLVTRVLNTSNASSVASVGPSIGARGASLRGASGQPVASSAMSQAAGQIASAAPKAGTLDATTESCRLTNLRQQADLLAAAVSLEQFQKHIDAMNLLVAGKISLAVATTFWEQSRVDASAKAAAFRAADHALTASAGGCPELGPTAACSAPAEQVNAITACAKAARAKQAVLTRARVAVTTWEHHIKDMDMFRMGHLSAAQMGAMWTKSWKTGQRQADAYSAALLAANVLKCPLT